MFVCKKPLDTPFSTPSGIKSLLGVHIVRVHGLVTDTATVGRRGCAWRCASGREGVGPRCLDGPSRGTGNFIRLQNR
jgi:hypothetical protein